MYAHAWYSIQGANSKQFSIAIMIVFLNYRQTDERVDTQTDRYSQIGAKNETEIFHLAF